MDKTYKPQQIENKWYQHWQSLDAFKPSGSGPGFCMMIPPPNVTGTLHMGHGFQVTLQDTLTRYYRMQGYNTLWQMGTDHAGIATQMVVERQLAQQGKTAAGLGRERFEKEIWRWTENSSKHIRYQLKRLGASVDWDRERFTLDETMSKAVHYVFNQLYHDDYIYQSYCLVNWDPELQTALSDLEVESQEEQGQLWYFTYPLSDSDEQVIIATTRPETMLGDTAVAVHPDDNRYAHLIGHSINLPLAGRQIPVIADEAVDPEFGTGCLKITPAHDFNDYAMGKRHDLPMINILTETGYINEQAPQQFQGMDRFEARRQVVKAMEDAGHFVKSEPHQLKVPRGDRSGAIIEPYLTKQWFVRTRQLAQRAKQAAVDGDMRFIPANWINTYNQWLDNIEDWCISRQLWWGYRIPAWYDKQGNTYVGESEDHVRDYYRLAPNTELNQDEEVLDTWFSSALWPFATLGWPQDSEDYHHFYPTQVLVTGFDIIFFWVARMVMMGLHFTDQVPFKDVYITGLIRDRHGNKMSKSKGNVLDPLDLIEGIDLDHLVTKRTQGMMQPQKAKQVEKATKEEFPEGIPGYGTDALRFTFCALASPTRNINFDTGRLEGYRNFCNKIWNAARFVHMQLESCTFDLHHGEPEYSQADRWIRSRLQRTINDAHHHLKQYRFDLLAETLYDYLWHQFCDWYIELAKTVLNDAEASIELRRGAARTLAETLETAMRLLHPVMPFITEEIWQLIAPMADVTGNSVMIQSYPAEKQTSDEQAENAIEWLQQFVSEVRNIRGEMNISPKSSIHVLLTKGSDRDDGYLNRFERWIKILTRAEAIDRTTSDEVPDLSATGLVGSLEIHVPLAGHIDLDAEITRLDKELQKLRKTITRSEDKLNNPKFVQNAPQSVVEEERQRLQDNQAALDKLQKRYELLAQAKNTAQ